MYIEAAQLKITYYILMTVMSVPNEHIAMSNNFKCTFYWVKADTEDNSYGLNLKCQPPTGSVSPSPPACDAILKSVSPLGSGAWIAEVSC